MFGSIFGSVFSSHQHSAGIKFNYMRRPDKAIETIFKAPET